MRKLVMPVCLGTGLLLAALPAIADPASVSPVPSTPPTTASNTTDSSTPDPDEIVCRAGEPPMGSHIPGPRICHTRRDWDAMRKQNQEDVERMQQTGLTGGRPDN